MLGAYKSGSAEVRVAITDISLGSKLHGVCILVILVWTSGDYIGNTYIGNTVWEVLYGLYVTVSGFP